LFLNLIKAMEEEWGGGVYQPLVRNIRKYASSGRLRVTRYTTKINEAKQYYQKLQKSEHTFFFGTRIAHFYARVCRKMDDCCRDQPVRSVSQSGGTD
jgi:hypothetical protein